MADRLSEAALKAWKVFRELSDAGVPNEYIAGMSTTLDRGLREARKRAHLTLIRGQADERTSERYVDEPEAG